ncbi:fbox domain containing protein [Nannochloropsis oceanica]
MPKHTTTIRQHEPTRHVDSVPNALSLSDPYGTRAIIPVVRGRPRFPRRLALQFAMDEGDEDKEEEDNGSYDSAEERDREEEEQEDEKVGAGLDVMRSRCDHRVTCRALVLHPTKYNRDLFLHKNDAAALRRPRPTMETLPQDTLKQIFRFLPAHSLLASEIVCRLWRDLASMDDAHWEQLCKRAYGISPENFSPPPDPVKLLYMLTYSSLSEIKYGANGGGSGRMQGSLRFLF